MTSVDPMMVKWDHFKRRYTVWVITRSEGDLLDPNIEIPIEVFTDHVAARSRVESLRAKPSDGRRYHYHVHRIPIFGEIAATKE